MEKGSIWLVGQSGNGAYNLKEFPFPQTFRNFLIN